MISSLYQHHSHLFSISQNTLAIYDLSQFINLPWTQFPKIQSQLGIALRQPLECFLLPVSYAELRFANLQHGSVFGDLLIMYHKGGIIAVETDKLVSHEHSLNIIFNLSIDSLFNNQDKDTQISSVIYWGQKQNSSKKLVITTTNGQISVFSFTSSNELKLEVSKNITSILAEKKSIMQDQTKDFLSSHHMIKGKSSKKEFVSALAIKENGLFCATSQGKLVCLNKNSLQLMHEYQTAEVNVKQHYKQLSSPLKIFFVRNSVFVLFPGTLLEFNIHTHILIEQVTLPYTTLDITVQHHPKTLQTTLVMVGECNVHYSIPYPWNLGKQKPAGFKMVKISSQLSKCVISTNNNYLFVGGSDGVIDVFKNIGMQLMVLVQTKL